MPDNENPQTNSLIISLHGMHLNDEDIQYVARALPLRGERGGRIFPYTPADAILVSTLIILFNPISTGFLEEIGKDLYDLSKKRIIEVLSRKPHSSVEFVKEVDTVRIRVKVTSTDPAILERAMDMANDGYRTAENVLRDKGIPENASNLVVEYDPVQDRYKVTRAIAGPETIFDYDEETGTWS